MKGIKKAVIGLVAGIVAIFGVAALAACSDNSNNNNNGGAQTVTGQYDYYAHKGEENEMHYGVKVNVTVKDGKITKVEIDENSGLTQLTPSWTEPGHDAYEAGEAGLLQKYVGLDVDDVLAVDVQVRTEGENSKFPASGWQPVGCPVEDTVEGYVPYVVDGETLLVDGATQSSGRLLLAVQNALEKLDK